MFLIYVVTSEPEPLVVGMAISSMAWPGRNSSSVTLIPFSGIKSGAAAQRDNDLRFKTFKLCGAGVQDLHARVGFHLAKNRDAGLRHFH